jgi:hypothetical protein
MSFWSWRKLRNKRISNFTNDRVFSTMKRIKNHNETINSDRNLKRNFKIWTQKKWVLRAVSLGLKWPNCEADHWPTSGAGVRNVLYFHSTSLLLWCGLTEVMYLLTFLNVEVAGAKKGLWSVWKVLFYNTHDRWTIILERVVVIVTTSACCFGMLTLTVTVGY